MPFKSSGVGSQLANHYMGCPAEGETRSENLQTRSQLHCCIAADEAARSVLPSTVRPALTQHCAP
jgi:hypothetical protein